MPAAAVIPAPIAYINVVAVKKLVVGFRMGVVGRVRKGSQPCYLRFFFGIILVRLALSCRLYWARRLL